MAAGGPIYNRQMSVGQSAHPVQFTSADYNQMVREMLPRERFGPDELLRWLEDTQECNERAKRSHAKRRAALRASLNIPP